MPSLRELQRTLKTVFTHPRGVDAGLAAAGFGPGRPVTRLVADRPPVPLAARLAVYADAYFYRLLESLGQDFAGVRRALGDEPFQRLVAEYLMRRPSRSPFINDAGEGLPAFLKGHAFTRRLPFLADLAALEQAALRALLTDRRPPLDAAAWGAVPPEAWPRARLLLDPTVRLLRVSWAVEKLWEGRGKEGGSRRAAARPGVLLVYRDDGWVRVRRTEEAEFRALAALQAGKRLGTVLKLVQKAGTGAPVGEWFSRWTREGVLKGVSL